MITVAYPCPCCGHLTVSEPPPGTFEICPVCFWEDDSVQANDPEFVGGANSVSLKKAKENFARLGASDERHIKDVREPLPEELPAEVSRSSTTEFQDKCLKLLVAALALHGRTLVDQRLEGIHETYIRARVSDSKIDVFIYADDAGFQDNGDLDHRFEIPDYDTSEDLIGDFVGQLSTVISG